MAGKNEKLFDEIKKHADDIKSLYSNRNQQFETYENMYLMKGTENARGNETVKLTVSPSAHNKVVGAERLLQSQKVRFDCHSVKGTKQETEYIEQSVSKWWEAMYSVNGKPLMNEIIHSAALYSDVHIGVMFLDDYKQYNPDDKRIERLARRTPVLFEVWNPRFGYAERDAMGLSAYYQELQVSASYIESVYGGLLKKDFNKTRTTKVTLKRFWDNQYYAIWYDNELLDVGEHGLPCIPVSVSSAEGSDLFEDQEDTYEPLLFALARSGLWERENMALTTLYTTAAAIAFTPSFKWKTDSAEPLITDISDGVQYYKLNKGDDVEALTNKGVFTREVADIINLTTNLVEQSTIHDTAFGGQGNGSANFSEATLLAQSARLPLMPVMKTVGKAIGDIMQIALDLMREKGISFEYGNIKIMGSKIPEDLTVDAKLDVILPQERTQIAATAATIVSNGLASKEWVRSEVMGLPNNEQIEEQIAAEKINSNLVEYYTQKMMNELVIQDQMKQQQQQMQIQQQNARNQEAMQAGMMAQQQQPAGMDMGGAQNIPVGVEQSNPALQAIQAQAMQNNINESGMPQVPEANVSPSAGIAGGMPSEMMGLIPGA